MVVSLQESNQKFVASKQSNEVISGRETALRNLDVAYNAFVDIVSNTKDAMEVRGKKKKKEEKGKRNETKRNRERQKGRKEGRETGRRGGGGEKNKDIIT